MKTLKKIVFVFGLLTIGILLLNAYQGKFDKKNNETNEATDSSQNVSVISTPQTEDDKSYAIYALDIPQDLTFAGEQVPLSDQEVFERVDREFLVNTYWQSNGLLLFKRANKYFPIIEPILAENGVPDDFKYLAVIESGLQNVTSPAGAKGFWQIMRATGKELGLEVNSNVDERYHLEKATEAACTYLKRAKNKFGSWTLAAAAYNAGNGRVSKELEKQQVANYYDLLLTSETARYVPRLLALKYILSNPKEYGFHFQQKHLYNPEVTKSVMIDSTITNLSIFAQKQGINYKQLKMLNHWLRQNTLNNASKKEYQILIPAK